VLVTNQKPNTMFIIEMLTICLVVGTICYIWEQLIIEHQED